MKVIVDANIVFSGILNSHGKIGDLLINSKKQIEFIASIYLRSEIYSHYSRLSKISKLNKEQIHEAEYLVYKNISFISEEFISKSIWISSEKLVADIDPKDIQYIAFAKHFRCKLWSGDKTLRKGLEKKGFHKLVSTEELYEWRKSKNSL